MTREHEEQMLSNFENITFTSQVGGHIPPTSVEHLTKLGLSGAAGSAKMRSHPSHRSPGQSKKFCSWSSTRFAGEPVKDIDRCNEVNNTRKQLFLIVLVEEINNRNNRSKNEVVFLRSGWSWCLLATLNFNESVSKAPASTSTRKNYLKVPVKDHTFEPNFN